MSGSDGSSDRTSFSHRLRDLRARAKLSQEELADLARLSSKTVGNLERSTGHQPYPSSVLRLADALKLTGPARAEFIALSRGRPVAPANGEQAMLTGPPPGNPPPGGAAAATRTLPRDIASFTGRQDELARLTRTPSGPGNVVAIYAIGGMAGIGKTAFAVHAAHRLAPQFPDGQLFLPLHGHTPGYRPVDPADALASLLQTFGVASKWIPPTLDERVRMWRDHLAGKRVLLVLDDAVDSEQVRPLLPGTGGCLVVVTSRRHLTAMEDAETISLDVLSAAEAAALLVRLAARPHLDPGDAGVKELCDLAGYLPLAIGMLARQLCHHQTWTPAWLAAEMAATRNRLELMETENVSVTAGFDLSYADLSADQQRLFRRLSLHPGDDIDAYAAAALDDCSLATARRQLAALYDQYLLAEPASGRYRLHDLIREHASTLSIRDDPACDRDQALSRLLDYYTYAATIAETRLAQQTRPILTAPPGGPPAAVPDLAGYGSALVWARAERANLLACLDHVTVTGQLARVVALTAALATLLRHDGPLADAASRHNVAVHAARQLDDRFGQADALNQLGAVLQMTADCRNAARALEEALGIYRDLGNPLGQANVLNNLGIVFRMTSDYPRARKDLETALGIYRDLGNRLGQANALNHLGGVLTLTGQYPAAARAQEAALRIYRGFGDRRGQASVLNDLGAGQRLTGDYAAAALALEQALGISCDLGDRRGQGNALCFLGFTRLMTGDYAGAAQAEEASLRVFRELGDRRGQANALNYLGAVRSQTGDYPGAAEALQAALDLYRRVGDRGGAAEALNQMGNLHLTCGNQSQAASYHQQALELARVIGTCWDEAHALAGLGRCALASGEAVEAKACLRAALEIFQRLGSAEATGLAAELAALDRH